MFPGADVSDQIKTATPWWQSVAVRPWRWTPLAKTQSVHRHPRGQLAGDGNGGLHPAVEIFLQHVNVDFLPIQAEGIEVTDRHQTQ